MDSNREQGPLLRSFGYAYHGLVYVFRHQRNMRIHFGLALAALVASLLLDLSPVEILAVFAAITFVLVAEMINTAIEATVDMIASEHHPRAKVAKDVAAGAVLIAAVNALVVAYLVFADKAAGLSANTLAAVRRSPPHLTFVTMIVVVLVVVVVKARGRRVPGISGGLPSGHAAVAFAGWTAVTFVAIEADYGMLISGVTFIMALLTAQSRVESGIHTTVEVVLGGLLGAVITTLAFQLWY